MSTLLILIAGLPLLMTALCIVTPRRFNELTTVAVGGGTLAMAVALVPAATRGTVTAVGYLSTDALSVVFLLATALLYALTAVYSIGYFAEGARQAARTGADAVRRHDRYSRRFYIGLNAFAWSMLCAPLVNGLALLWVAIEITTVVSALLVALDNTDGAAEAAWKYVLIASSGLGIALLSTIVLYYAGSQVLGVSYDLAFEPLLQVAHNLPATPVQLAFGLAVVGYGTKVGLFPVHTWLPDAHAEAPTPVSALLSGALLATSFYAILRYFQIAVAALGPTFPQRTLLIFGVLSLLLGALYLFDQHNIKRMLAYSSIEHMGILAIGVSFGAPLAFLGVLLHVLAHAAGKGAAFMGAGVLVEKYGTKDISRIRDGMSVLPWSGPLFLLAVFALSAVPPFGIFRSEFLIVAGGLSSPHGLATAVLVALVTFAFFGLAVALTQMLSAPNLPGTTPVAPGEPSAWMVAPVVVAVVVLAVLGVHPPGQLLALLNAGAAQLQGSPR
ncbi:MAG: proton-conducting transporter membrane subunit [Propionibacteriaceae bacterium]